MSSHSVRKFLSAYIWDIALGYYDEGITEKGIDWKKLNIVHNPYKKKWFADPFILSDDGENVQLLVEEFDSDVRKGRIARITISKKNYEITDCSIILEIDTHLSFPAIYREGDTIFVHPENSASGKSIIYRYDREQDRLVDPIVLVPAPLTDAVIIKNGKAFYMYSTVLPNNGGPILHVYQSVKITGPYEEVDCVDFGKKTARMAGAMLETTEGRIRPAQDCTHDYGEAVLFYKDKTLVGEIRPRKNDKFAGVHTFNVLQDTFVIDLKRYCHHEIRNFVKKLLRKV